MAAFCNKNISKIGFILIFSACRNIKNPSKEGFYEHYSTKKVLGKDFMA
jgi:hypothetical protein